MRQGDQRPTLQEEVIYRPHEQLLLFDKKVINDTVAKESDAIACAPFRKFGLYVNIDSTGSPTDLHIEIEFLDRWTGQWHSYKQGPFSSLYYEDTDTASGIYECFVGDVLGRALRVKLTGTDTDADNYFTVSVGIDLWN